MRRQGTSPELALPVSSLIALREALEAEVGPAAAASALRHAGHAAGDALFPLLTTGTDDTELPEQSFWRRVAELFAARGWGRLEFQPVHPGIGALETADWVEADPAGAHLQPGCHFTTGLLSNLLGQAAGDQVGVLEVDCRSRGDLSCRFLFGGREALETLHEALAAGASLEQALGQLA